MKDHKKLDIMETSPPSVEPTSLISQELKYLRENRKMSIEEVAHQLRVSPSYIQAIESGNVDLFPERVYILGFVRSYAKLLNIDSDICIQRFKAEILQEDVQSSLTFLQPLSSDSAPSFKILLYSTLGFIVVFIFGYGTLKWNQPASLPISIEQLALDNPSPYSKEASPSSLDQELAQAEEQEEEEALPASSVNSLPEPSLTAVDHSPKSSAELSLSQETIPAKSSSQEQSPSSQEFTFHFTQECWIEIKNADQQVVLQKTFQANDHLTPPTGPGHTLRVGNAGGIQIHFKDGTIKTLGNPGQILTNVSLDAAALSDYVKAH